MTKETTNTIPSNYIPGQDPLDDYIAEPVSYTHLDVYKRQGLTR